MTQITASEQSCDVLIIGGGPAGSTAATRLAEKGHHVVVIEQDRFPRFHIGESLLPVNNSLFETLGVLDQVEKIAMIKQAAQFDSMYHDKKTSFYFNRALNRRYDYGYEVHRADLDKILLDNCRAKGAEVHEETRVTAVNFDDPAQVKITTRSETGEKVWQARFLIDASGRDTFLANRFKSKKPHPKHASAAIYGHFEDVERLPGNDAGNITLFWFDHGWFWLIPLQHGITSVGMVCWPYYLKTRQGDLDSFFQQTVASCPPLAMRMKQSRLTRPVTATGNYSYLSSRMSGDRYLMLGDAFAFIDPIFSSGVLLAMKSAFLGADAVDASLRNPASTARNLRVFEKSVVKGLRGFTWLIFRMTSPVMRNLLISPRNVLRVEESVLAILAGDVHDNREARLRMQIFKAIYYIGCLLQLPTSIRAWFRHRQQIRVDA